MKHLILPFMAFLFLFSSCDKKEVTEYERTNGAFLDNVGGNYSRQQWWRTAVSLAVNVKTDGSVRMWLLCVQNDKTYLCDYNSLTSSGNITMTAPQGLGNTFILAYEYKKKVYTQTVTLSGKTEEIVNISTVKSTKASIRRASPPASLCGNSINGNAQYFQFSPAQMEDYFEMMALSNNNSDAKQQGLNTNYELKSHGPFYITWVNGYEADQRSRILGYYTHPTYSYDKMTYHDLSETHKWDYIDGLAKVQYQIDINDTIDGHIFRPNTWYDANFDMSDSYGSKKANNKDRLGDNAYNSQLVYNRYDHHISALRGISFLIDAPEGTRVGFYLRSDEEPDPDQWTLLKEAGVATYPENQKDFKGTCFCVEAMNIEGNGKGKHRSFAQKYDEVIWMGMEDLLNGGDHDCNDVIFGVVAAGVDIELPEIVSPELDDIVDPDDPDNPDNPNDFPDHPIFNNVIPFPWTIAYEDVNRDPDFDFNDAVIKLLPDYENERCCVWVMAAGSTSRMYLHFNGPDGDHNLGEVHELMNSSQTYINTDVALANKPFVQVDCVPWPKGYTMANDAQRFYIEVQRGTCDDCTDVITLAQEPGKMPEALLVAGEWHWPMEGKQIFSAYEDFSTWARDVTRTDVWEWYKTSKNYTSVSY